VLHYRKAKSCAAAGAAAVFVNAVEALEDAGAMFFGDAYAVVLDGDGGGMV